MSDCDRASGNAGHIHQVPSENNGFQRHFKSQSSDLSPRPAHSEQRNLLRRANAFFPKVCEDKRVKN